MEKKIETILEGYRNDLLDLEEAKKMMIKIIENENQNENQKIRRKFPKRQMGKPNRVLLERYDQRGHFKIGNQIKIEKMKRDILVVLNGAAVGYLTFGRNPLGAVELVCFLVAMITFLGYNKESVPKEEEE